MIRYVWTALLSLSSQQIAFGLKRLFALRFICTVYSRPSLSRPRLSRINVYIEGKFWSLFIMEILEQLTKYCGKEEKLLLRSNFSSFPHYYIYISGVKLHIHLLNMVVRFIVFLTFATLICRGTDISKCFRESLGIRENESRLYALNIGTLPSGHTTLNQHRFNTLNRRYFNVVCLQVKFISTTKCFL